VLREARLVINSCNVLYSVTQPKFNPVTSTILNGGIRKIVRKLFRNTWLSC